MATKAEIAAKIQADIQSITTPGGIKKSNVAEILSDIVNLANPESVSGQPVQVGTLDGYPWYKKLFFVPDGNNLSNVDLSLPANHALINISSVKEQLEQLNSRPKFEVAEVNLSNFPNILFKGLSNEFKIDGSTVNTADLTFTFSTDDGYIDVSGQYTSGQDMVIDAPQVAGGQTITKIIAENITGLTPGSSISIEISVSVNGTIQNFSYSNANFGNDKTIFKYGNIGSGPLGIIDSWSIIPKVKKIRFQNDLISGDVNYDPVSLQYKLTFEDLTTEEFTLTNPTMGQTVEIAKDLSSFGETTPITIELLNSSVINVDGNPVNIFLEPATTIQYYTEQYLGSLEYINLSGAVDLVASQKTGFIENIINSALSNDPAAINIFITLDYIDLTPAP